MRRSLIMMFAAASAIAAVAAPAGITGTITTEAGDTNKGLIRWSARDKAYVITKGGVELQVKATDVAEIDIAKPAGWDQIVAQVEKGQGAAAVAPLSKIVKEYAHLEWDRAAARYLTEAHLAAGNPEKALAAAKEVIDGEKSAAYKGELAPAYWDALLALNRTSTLEEVLGKAAASGDRYSSGMALVKRGDLIFKAGGESSDAAKKALTDGYLRAALLYTDAAVASKVRPEALYKAAKCFEKLGQSGRADSFRTELKKLYAASPWAAK